MPDQLTITVAEAGKRLGFGRDAAYIAARQGKIPVIKMGRCLRVPVEALNRLLAGDDSLEFSAVVTKLEVLRLESRISELDAQRAELVRQRDRLRQQDPQGVFLRKVG